MGRKYRVLLLCLLLMLLAGGASAQLPIYQQWSQTYLLEGMTHGIEIRGITVLPNSSQGEQQPLYVASVSSDYCTSSQGNPWPTCDFQFCLCVVDSADLNWQRTIDTGGCWCPNLYSLGSPSVQSDGVIALSSTDESGNRQLSAYDINGDQLWSQEEVTSFHPQVVSNSRGFVTFEYDRARLLSFSGDTLASYDGVGRVRTANSFLDNRTIVLSEYPTFEVIVLDSNLELISSQPINNAAFALATTNSGNIFANVWISNTAVRLLKLSESGSLIDEQTYTFSPSLRRVGYELVPISDSILCFWTEQRISGISYRYVNFFNENLDSLGRMEIDFNASAICSDGSGDLIVSSAAGQNLTLRLYSSTQTPAHDTQFMPSDIKISTYPNPFNSLATISFDLPEATNVQLHIFDITGRQVATLVDEFKDPGTYTVTFDAADLPSGVYIYAFDSGNFSHHGKLLLLK